MRKYRGRDEMEKEFIGIVEKLCYSRQKWEVWFDLITMMACALANSMDHVSGDYERREEEYADCLKRIGNIDLAAKAFAIVVEALDQNPDQDFLGALYMNLELGNHWRGQFFTPYCLCQAMAGINMGEAQAWVEERGYVSVCDPCVGGGAMLIAGANELRRKGINFHSQAIFIGQDIDRITGMMAYIQISLLGLPGYIVIADSLTNPLTGISDIEPVRKKGQEFWFTPFYFTETWVMRRKIKELNRMLRKMGEPVTDKQETTFTYFFNFEEEGNGRDYEHAAAPVRVAG